MNIDGSGDPDPIGVTDLYGADDDDERMSTTTTTTTTVGITPATAVDVEMAPPSSPLACPEDFEEVDEQVNLTIRLVERVKRETVAYMQRHQVEARVAYTKVLARELQRAWANTILKVNPLRDVQRLGRSLSLEAVARLFPIPPPMLVTYLREPKWNTEALIQHLVAFDRTARRIAGNRGLLYFARLRALWFSSRAEYPAAFFGARPAVDAVLWEQKGGVALAQVHPEFLAAPECDAGQEPPLELVVYSLALGMYGPNILIDHVPVRDAHDLAGLGATIAEHGISHFYTPQRTLLPVSRLTLSDPFHPVI